MNSTSQTQLTFDLSAADSSNVTTPNPFWNPRSGIFDGAQLQLAIVVRGWTVGEFAKASKVSLACLYNALRGYGVTDKTAIRLFKGLAMRQPIVRYADVSNVF